MSEGDKKNDSKTMREIGTVRMEFVGDQSSLSSVRTAEVRDLISQMIDLARKRGRPVETDQEVEHAA